MSSNSTAGAPATPNTPIAPPVSRRTPLDLLGLEYVFSQRGLLDPEGFLKAAEKRGVRLKIGHLEALHRSGDLVPFYRVHQGKEAIVKAWEPNGFMVPSPGTSLGALRQYQLEGRLFEGTEAFEPWGDFVVRKGGRSHWVSTFLYSPWQLLALLEAQLVLPSMKRIRSASFGERFSVEGRVFRSTRLTTAIAVILSALEPVYWPDLVANVRMGEFSGADRDQWFDVYLQWIQDRQAQVVLGWLRLTPDETVSLADGLVMRIKSRDPINQWVDLVRLMSPDKWKELAGDARLALDHRLGAEMLMRLRDELTDEGAALALPPPPMMSWTPQHDRFNRPMETLDEVLTDYGISPHPSLVIPLEGKTELILVGRSMEHLKVPRRRSYIELFDVGGNTKDYGLLARYVAVPELGREVRSDLVMLTRPITRFLILTDPENKLSTAEQREARRLQILGSIFASLPVPFRTERTRSQLNSLVSIETWTENESFEFAHFTNEEIAAAISDALVTGGEPAKTIDSSEVEAIRRDRGNLKSLLKRYPALKDRKDLLAEALWPYLRDRLDQHVKAGTIDQVPVGRILKKAIELATMSFRRRVGLEL